MSDSKAALYVIVFSCCLYIYTQVLLCVSDDVFVISYTHWKKRHTGMETMLMII